MKRLFALALCFLLVFSCMMVASATTTSADEANTSPTPTRWSYINNTTTSIGISGGKAICAGSITGYKGITTKVEITLTLQRKLASSSTWDDFYNHPKQIFNDYCGTASFSKAIVSGYQYRTKAFYTAYSGSSSESLTQYSSVVSY